MKDIEELHKKTKQRTKRNLKIVIITTSIMCAIIAFLIVLNAVIIPHKKYNDAIAKYNNAIALIEAGKYVDAREALIALDGFKDSAEIADSIYIECKKEELRAYAQEGNHIYFGNYEQDNNTSNGKEPILWKVINKDSASNKILVISRFILDCKPYHTTNESITWENCSLRQWLNDDFYNTAFSKQEKELIATTKTFTNYGYGYKDEETNDNIFLITYIPEGMEDLNEATEYAAAQGKFDSDYDRYNCYWWLRSPGYYNNGYHRAQVVVAQPWDRRAPVGEVSTSGDLVNTTDSGHGGVRPAMWISLE